MASTKAWLLKQRFPRSRLISQKPVAGTSQVTSNNGLWRVSVHHRSLRSYFVPFPLSSGVRKRVVSKRLALAEVPG